MSEPQTFYGVNPIFRVHHLAISVPWLDMYGHTWIQDAQGNPIRQT